MEDNHEKLENFCGQGGLLGISPPASSGGPPNAFSAVVRNAQVFVGLCWLLTHVASSPFTTAEFIKTAVTAWCSDRVGAEGTYGVIESCVANHEHDASLRIC